MHNFISPSADISSPMIPGLLRIKRLDSRATMPRYQSAGAAGFDLHAVLPDGEVRYVQQGRPVNFSIGLAFEVPPGWVMQLHSRSGHGFKSSVRLVNCTGIIDSDFRGEMRVKLIADECDAGEHLLVRHGDRIAQAVLVPAPQFELVEVDALSDTVRGTRGYGSTGQ